MAEIVVVEGVYDTNDQDVVHEFLKEFNSAIDRNNHGWDNYEHPMLLAVFLDGTDHTVQALQMPIPPVFDHVVPMLRWLTDMVQNDPNLGPLGELLADPTFYGWVLEFEGWGLKVPAPQPGDDPVEFGRRLTAVRQASAERGIHKHPDRIEERDIFLVSVFGRETWLHQVRGGDLKLSDSYPDQRELRVAGSVAEALREFVGACQPHLAVPKL